MKSFSPQSFLLGFLGVTLICPYANAVVESNLSSAHTSTQNEYNLNITPLEREVPSYETNRQGIEVAGFFHRVACAAGIRTPVTGFVPLEKYRDRQGLLTDGDYRVSRQAMTPHESGNFRSGKSQFYLRYTGEAADILVLDASQLADRLCLWDGNKAKVLIVNGPIGVLNSTGTPTSWLNIYRTSNRLVHGSPGNPP